MASPRTISIDGDTLIIQFLEVGDFDAKSDIYSEWKEWTKEGDNLKYPPAFDTTGGDPVTLTQNISAFYFMRNDLGWRLKAPEANGFVNVDGDIFARDAATELFLVSDGAFSNVVQLLVSSKSLVNQTGISGLTPTESAALVLIGELEEADQFFDKSTSLLHYYRKGTVTDLIPAKTVAGEQVADDVTVAE